MAMITPKAALGIAAGVCGTLFLGYCIYFDHRRHADPDFKKKLRERNCGRHVFLRLGLFGFL